MVNSHNSGYFPGGPNLLVAGNGDAVALSSGISITNGTLTIAALSSGTGTSTSASSVPGQVTGLTSATATNSYVSLTWTAPTSGGTPTGYTISYGVSGGVVVQVMTGSAQASYILTGLNASTTYTINVCATNSAGSGTASSNASITTAAPPSSTNAPPPIPALGIMPSAPAARVTVYQVQTAAYVNASSNSVTINLNSFTAGSNIAVIANGGGVGSPNAVISATGLTSVKDLKYANSWQALWFGPSSAISGNTITFTKVMDVTTFLVVESNAKGADHTYGILGCPGIASRKYNTGSQGPGSINRQYNPTAADPASATSFVVAKTDVNGTLTVQPSITPIAQYPGLLYNGTYYHASTIFQVPAGSTTPIAITATNNTVSCGSTSCCATLNLYANPLAGNVTAASTQVVLANPTPAVIPPPAGGYPAYYQHNLASVQQGKQPRFTLGMFGASYVQGYTRLAKASIANGFAQARLDFASYNTIGDTYGSTQYSGRSNVSQNITGKMLCISFVPWSNNTHINDVAGGDLDDVYTSLADDLIANGSAQVMLRITWELNQQYYYNVDEHNCTDQFVNAIRRVVWLMLSRPGAQFVFSGPAPILVGGSDANGDPTNYLTGADATGNLSADAYITAYIDTNTPITAMTPNRITSLSNVFFNGYTSSTSWMGKYSKTYGRPIAYPEGAAGGTRRDGYGIGDVPELMTSFAKEILVTDPVAWLGWWMDNGGGTDSWIVPMTGWPNSSNFPLSYEIFKASFSPPQPDPDVLNGSIPKAPGLTLSWSNGALTIASTTSAGDTVNYAIKQVSIPGTHIWYTWNDVLPNNSISSNNVQADVDQTPTLPPAFVAGGMLDCRVLNSNTLGNSPWTQARINTSTNQQVGSTINYPSLFGLNEDGTCGPTLLPYEIPPTGTIGSGSASSQAVTVQKKCVSIPQGTTAFPTVAFDNPVNSTSYVVFAYIGGTGLKTPLPTPPGFTLIAARLLGIDQGGQIFFGPASALVSNGINLSGVSVPDTGMIVLEETTGSFIEFAAQNGSYGRDSFSANFMMTASQSGGAQSMLTAWDTAFKAISVSSGTIDATFDGASSGGFEYHSCASLSIPTGTHGLFNIQTAYNPGDPKTPEKPGYICWTTYTSAPPVVAQPTLASFNAAAGIASTVIYSAAGASSTTGTTTTTAPTTTPTKATVTQVNSGLINASPSTITLPAARTVGNTAIFIEAGYNNNAVLPSGWTQTVAGVQQTNVYFSAWSAPVSTLTNNGITIATAVSSGSGYLIEANATVFSGATYQASSAANGVANTLNPPAQSKPNALRFAMIYGYIYGANTPTATGATILGYVMPTSGAGAYSVLMSYPDASTAGFTLTNPGYGTQSNSVIFLDGYTS